MDYGSRMDNVENKPFVPSMRLTCQCSIPVQTEEESKALYNELKIFLLAFSTDITLNGQVVMMLEPCCKKQEKKNVEHP